jgi:hypothetical protein
MFVVVFYGYYGYNESSHGGLGGKRKTMFTQVFVSAPGESNPAWGEIIWRNLYGR